MKLNSGLGQLILKEEMEKERESRERASLAASRYDSPINSASHVLSSKTASLLAMEEMGFTGPFLQTSLSTTATGTSAGSARLPDPPRWPHAWNEDGPGRLHAQHVGTKDISV